jgi:predicted RNA-binding protein with TRAM domain
MSLDYTYPKDGSKPCAKEPLKVKHDGVHCGEIRKVKDGFQYFVKGSKTGGTVFVNVAEVQKNLTAAQIPRTEGEKKETPDQKEPLEKKLRAATDRLRESEKHVKGLGEAMEGAMMLLQACADLLSQQTGNKETVNMLNAQVVYDNTECDGISLLEDLTAFLDSGE